MAKIITDNQHYSAIAEAIRTKNETETLYKPSEMASAILEIQGGGGDLNFEVVGGSRPSNPDENTITIWVDTGTAINGWVFSATEPEEYADGTVWFATGTTSDVSFNALTENRILLAPIQAKQRINGAWENVTAETFMDGKWRDWWNGDIFKDGNISKCNTFTLVNTLMSVIDGVLIFETTGNTYSLAHSDIMLDVTGVDKIVVDFKYGYTYNDSVRGVGIFKTIPNEVTPSGSVSFTKFTSGDFSGECVVNTSGFNGLYYLVFAFAGSSAGNGKLQINSIEMRRA